MAASNAYCTFAGTGDFGGDLRCNPEVRAGNGGAGEKRLALWNSDRLVYYWLSGASHGLWDSTGGFNRMTLDSAGNFAAYGNVTAYSDERVKTGFFDMNVSLDEMLSIKPEGFKRIDSGIWQVGVRAQSLRPILPLAVTEDEKGYLSVNYGSAAMILILNLAREVAELKRKLNG